MNTQLINGSRGAMNGITNSMQNFGFFTGESGKYLMIINSALQFGVGMMGMWNVAIQLWRKRNTAETAKAAMLTSINSTNPIGWGKIAMATATAAVAGAGLTVLVDRINLGAFDLSTTAGRSEAVEAVQGVM